MTTRVRYCIECPKCRTRYLVAFSPYGNGSYVISTVDGSFEEYTLYCSCGSPGSQWNCSEMKPCEVSKAAYRRGYGTDEEILQIANRRRETRPFDVVSCLSLKSTDKKPSVHRR